ncbi:MAG: SDR family oxidoreductase [Pseudomonadota bacterium]|uniref:SDR family oxidoreductase n=1 Tax=Sphingomonas sp. ERG5 TaxID=1381597 RepID=UPI00054C78C1|nr:SDR family oxidoreductase [Sphingomonas sp. ERG5]
MSGTRQLQIVVIGGTSGIGLAIAMLMAGKGLAVTIVGRDQDRLDAAVARIGGGARGEAIDAADGDALRALFKQLGTVDHLVIAASGGAGAGPFASLDAAALRRGFEAKFWVHWTAAQAVLDHLPDTGSITFITAASSRLANPGTSGLAAINGALEHMVRTLARELAPRRINAVSPGVIDTPWWHDKPDALFQSASKQAPLGRPGEAAEVADAVAFLIGNRFVTGVILDVDGGLHLT